MPTTLVKAIVACYQYNVKTFIQIMKQQGFDDHKLKQSKIWKSIRNSKIQNFPFSSLLLLKSSNSKGQINIGTAFLINNLFALTAAHNLFDQTGKPYDKIFIQHSPVEILQIKSDFDIEVTSFKYKKQFKHLFHNFKDSLPYDLALLKLSKEIALDKYFSYFQNMEMDCEQGLQMGLMGYRGQDLEDNWAKPKIKLKKIISINYKEGIIKYSFKTMFGQSGSPIFVQKNDKIILIGVHIDVNHKQNCNRGILITKLVLEQIKIWIHQINFEELQIYKQRGNDVLLVRVSSIIRKCYKEEKLLKHQETISTFAQQKNNFIFNWDTTILSLDIQNKKLIIKSNILTNDEASITTAVSFQNFPFKSLSIVKFRFLAMNSNVTIFLISQRQKQQISKMKPDQRRNLQTYGILALQNVKKIGFLKSYTNLYLQKQLIQQQKSWFSSAGDIWTLQVDTMEATVRIKRNNDKISQLEDCFNNAQKIYLGINLGTGDSIEMLKK